MRKLATPPVPRPRAAPEWAGPRPQGITGRKRGLFSTWSYDGGTSTVSDGGATTLMGFGPSAVPKPSALALSGIGATLLVGLGFRRKLLSARPA